MSIRDKVILATIVIKGAATFGFILYAMVNFAKWLVKESTEVEIVEEINP